MQNQNPLTRHLDSVNETYFEHLGHALGFAVRMIGAGLACLVHGLLPFCFQKTGSNCIERLHDRMVVNRHKLSRAYRRQNEGHLIAQRDN